MSAAEVIAEALDSIPADSRPAVIVNRVRATKALDALKAAGYAVVELLEPSEIKSLYTERTAEHWPITLGGECESVYLKASGEVVISGHAHFDIEDVPALAAALLAAANAAEATS